MSLCPMNRSRNALCCKLFILSYPFVDFGSCSDPVIFNVQLTATSFPGLNGEFDFSSFLL